MHFKENRDVCNDFSVTKPTVLPYFIITKTRHFNNDTNVNKKHLFSAGGRGIRRIQAQKPRRTSLVKEYLYYNLKNLVFKGNIYRKG